MSRIRKILAGCTLIALVGCQDDLDELNASLAELNSSLEGARQEIQSGRTASANTNEFERRMTNGRSCTATQPQLCSISQFRQARDIARRNNNTSQFNRASRALLSAYERTGDRSGAVNVAVYANEIDPTNSYFANYIRRNGLQPLNLDGSQPTYTDCTWDLACAIRNTPGGDVAAGVVAVGAIGLGTAIANAGPPRSSGTTSATGNSSAGSQPVATNRSNGQSSGASTSRGVKSITPRNDGQFLVECTTRGSERYWWRDGQWYSGTGLGGSIGSSNLTIDQLAARHCGV